MSGRMIFKLFVLGSKLAHFRSPCDIPANIKTIICNLKKILQTFLNLFKCLLELKKHIFSITHRNESTLNFLFAKLIFDRLVDGQMNK